jgi:steroid delta-isomerase
MPDIGKATAEAAQAYRVYLETLTPDALLHLSTYVRPDVRFRDPFNDVHGADAMQAVLTDMFETVGAVRFRVSHCAVDADTCLMAWTFRADSGLELEGTSIVRFDAQGLVASHTDHWDAARLIYEKVPVLGALLRLIRRRLGNS